MANVNEIAFTYTSKSGKEVKGVTIAPADKFPAYQWFSQESLRFLAVYKAFGPDGTVAIVEGFANGQEFNPTDVFGYNDYNNHRLLVFRADVSDKRGLQFGAVKARALAGLFKKYGVKAFAALCQEVAGDASLSSYSPTKGKGKSKGGGGRKSADESSSSVEDLIGGLPEGLKNQLLGMLPKATTERADQSVKKAPAPAPQGTTVDELLQQEQQLLMQLMMVRSRINALAAVNS